jgi:hypothetical protein
MAPSTLQGIRAAFDQVQHQGVKEIYVISDGAHHGIREEIYAEVKAGYRRAPFRARINVLSFGGDREGNHMLHDLSVCGDGGFQYYLADLGR